jgi:hypothetical protein
MLFQCNSASERKTPLHIHGFVYGESAFTPKGIGVIHLVIDIATGALKDLNVTVKLGPAQKH